MTKKHILTLLSGGVGIFFIFFKEKLDKSVVYMYNTKLHNYDGAICPLVFFGDALYRVKIRGNLFRTVGFLFRCQKKFFDAGPTKKQIF